MACLLCARRGTTLLPTAVWPSWAYAYRNGHMPPIMLAFDPEAASGRTGGLSPQDPCGAPHGLSQLAAGYIADPINRAIDEQHGPSQRTATRRALP
jgi:hypothetical protein